MEPCENHASRVAPRRFRSLPPQTRAAAGIGRNKIAIETKKTANRGGLKEALRCPSAAACPQHQD